jgi:alkylation response protein AidB-like acyl-CoA dehydrogenase
VTTLDLSPTLSATEPALPLFRPEHDQLRASARRFVDREIAPHVDEWERAEDFPRELFRAVGDAGYLGLKFGAEVGGSGPDLLAAAVWIEELARGGSGGIAADLGASTDLAALYVHAAGDDAQRARFLPPLLRGERIGALAITEPDAGSDVAAISTRAVRDGDGWVLSGSKVFITNGSWCDDVVVAATVSPADVAPRDSSRPGSGSEDPHGRLTLFLVRAEDAAWTRRRLPMLGWRTSHTGELTFDAVRLDDDRRLGEVGGGFGYITTAFAWERLAMSLGAVAGAQRTLELAIAYAKEREAFGRPIAGFQVWRHRFADLHTRIATGRALTYRALRLKLAQDDGSDPGDPRLLLRTVAMAKLVTQRLAFDVADEGVQVHGGAGYMMEYPIQRAWRDARLGPIGGGTDEIMKEIIAKTYDL